MKFPEVSGKDLNGDLHTIPNTLAGKLNFLIVAYQQWQVRPIESWIPFLQKLVSTQPQVQFYELPTLKKYNFISQWMIDSGMRGGIREGKCVLEPLLYTSIKLNLIKLWEFPPKTRSTYS
jgi:hypothetical protein